MTEETNRGISLVIVNWNTKDLLLGLLQSLDPESSGWKRPVEVLVVDNDSSDGSVEAVREAYPWVHLLPQKENLGFAGGVNRGLERARYPWVCLVNTDVVARPEAFEALLEYAERHPEAGVVGPRILNEDGSLQNSFRRFPSIWMQVCLSLWFHRLAPNSPLLNGERYSGTRFEQPAPVDYVSGCLFLMRRDLIDKIGGLDEGFFMYFEETDFCQRTWKAGYEVHYAPVSTFAHHAGASAKKARKRTFLAFRRSQIRYMKLHKGRFAAFWMRLAMMLFLLLRVPVWLLLSLMPGERGAIARSNLSVSLSALGDLLKPHPWIPPKTELAKARGEDASGREESEPREPAQPPIR
ncbi:MAG TPA: glycosyltransferase family 2 protein [Planctomycetes bacterium]|nr:glycosyltransferase family 2 protein [Planctomycetota bacterium]